jgi:hypothetical protein
MRAGEDTAANDLLWRHGGVAYRSNEVRFVHHSPCSTIPRLLKHHHIRGRAFGRLLLEDWPRSRVARWLIGYVPRRILGTTRRVRQDGDADLQRQYRKAIPLVAAGVISAWVGALIEVFRMKRPPSRL